MISELLPQCKQVRDCVRLRQDPPNFMEDKDSTSKHLMFVQQCDIVLMPGFSNMRYRFCSDIDRLIAVLALHERKIAHPFDKCLQT